MRYFLSRFTPKIFRSPVYRFLYWKLKDEYKLDPEAFRNLKILILGPARTSIEELKSIDVRKYDIVVRMNNGLLVDLPLGIDSERRCDLIFHSLTDDLDHPDPDSVLMSGVKLLVHRTPKRSAFLSTLLAERRFAKVTKVKIIPVEYYDYWCAHLEGHSPSTGFICASFFLDAPTEEVAILGFTFFTTSYVKGYDARVTCDEVAAERVRASGHHNPEAEALQLDKAIGAAVAAGKTVSLGEGVQTTINAIKQKALVPDR